MSKALHGFVSSQALRILLLALTAMHSCTASAQSCSPPPGGPPNSCPGVASTGGSGGPNSGVGNPINVITGNKYQREDDMPALPGVLGIEIVRHYNSAYSKPDSRNGTLGRGWRLSYETEIYDQFGMVQVLQADGGRVIFDKNHGSVGLCTTHNPANGTMVVSQKSNGMFEYTWTWTNGRILRFNSAGKLDRISAPTGEVVTLQYDKKNVLVRVTDPQGRVLSLGYSDRKVANHFHGVQFIDTPVGRFSYEYGSKLPKGSGLFDEKKLLANLVRVRLPTAYDPKTPAHPLTSRGVTTSNISRIYHHEDPRSPWVLTGISVESIGEDRKPVTSRYATYGYDGDARAILSTHAGNVGRVTLDTSEGGKTVLTNSLGQKTTYRHTIIAGEHRLIEVRGAGCASCGETNVRYGYNDAGQLTETTKLSESGEAVSAIKTEFDKWGGPVRTGKLTHLRGKAQPVQWTTRFEYQSANFAPRVVARPSVVPGKEVLTRIVYNAVGQPLIVTSVGWVPNADGTQAAGQIEQTSSYRYATINGASLLTEIDGPLQNGKTNTPLDSDITIIEYDNRSNVVTAPNAPTSLSVLERYDASARPRGLVTRIIAPGNFITEVLERDPALRPTRLRISDGELAQVTTVASDWRGAPVDIELAAGGLRRRLHYDYNAAGQVEAITLPGRLRTAFEYDHAGQLHKTILPDGSGILTAQDTEGRIVRAARYLDAARGIAESLPDIHFDYGRTVDQPSKLDQVSDALGVLKTYRYNDLGHVAAIANALGVTTRLNYNAAGLLADRTDAADSVDTARVSMAYDSAGNATRITAANDVATVRRYDDFGRKVMEADPDHGVTLFRHDGAGRVVARIDETMFATRFMYDHANRLLAVGVDKQPNLIQYQYRGRQLSAVISTLDGRPERATERIHYQRDALGQVIKETRWLASVTPPSAAAATARFSLSFVTTSDYDEAGRLVGQTLPDGHRLEYRYAAANTKGARDRHKPGQLEAILFDKRIVVADIEQTIAGGMTGFTLSNGMRQQISLDRRGRIERLNTQFDRPSGLWVRIKAWISLDKSADAAMYRQKIRYDQGNRIIQISRQAPVIYPAGTQAKRDESYAYDRMNRLTTMVGTDGMHTSYSYDKGGNRVAEVSNTRPGAPRTVALEGRSGNFSYHYAPGSNRLLALTQEAEGTDAGMQIGNAITPISPASNNPSNTTQLLRSAWLYHATGVQLSQLKWQNGDGSSTNRRIVYNSGKRPIAVYNNGQLIARYHYNIGGERIAKTLYPVQPGRTKVALTQVETHGDTSYSLYRDQRMVAETDAAGRITAHYIYLFGKPVAKIEMAANDGAMHRLWRIVTMRTKTDASDMLAHIYAIATDHLGTPQQVMDEQQQVVWQAETSPFGQARVIHAKPMGTNAKPFVMNLRLPGQIFDTETTLHYNYLREYSPTIGRYTAPDPIGLSGGLNPYAYVSNNPLSNIDPLGLYQIDVHYYMTFFLAITAGVDKDTARRIALAAQYIDDNPVTEPMLPGHSVWDVVGSAFVNQPALVRYHFVQDGYDPERTMLEKTFQAITGFDSPGYISARIKNPQSPQLQRLLAASEIAKTDPNANCYSSIQLFGEYLHTLQDSFAHRNKDNEPYSASMLSKGIGHGFGGKHPDFTYNHWVGCCLGVGIWNNNEGRTLQMETEVFDKLKTFSNPHNMQYSISSLRHTLDTFNSFNADDSNLTRLGEKIEILNAALRVLGYKDINMRLGDENEGYNVIDAAKNRANALNGLNPEEYIGTILPRGRAQLPEEKK